LRPAVIANYSAVLACVERQSKVGSPTFQSPLNFHDLLRESFIVPFMVPSTSHSTNACAWLGLAIGSRTGLRSVRIRNASRDTSTVGRAARRSHIPHVSMSVTIQSRLGLCDLWLYFYRRTVSRRADDIFTAQRSITRSLCSAQSGDKKCK